MYGIKINEDWYESNCPSQEELNVLIRKMIRTHSNNHDIYHIMGRLNFKHLGPAFIVVMLEKHRDKPQVRFITKQRQNIIISLTDAKYIRHGHEIHKLHDDDAEMFATYMALIDERGNSNWHYILGEYNWWFPKYRIKCKQPDYSTLNSTR